MSCKTSTGPAMAFLDGRPQLFFRGHNNYNIWHATYELNLRWKEPYRINNQLPDYLDPMPESELSWAFTRAEPAAVGKLLGGTEWKSNYLIFRGHNNDRVWYTRQMWDSKFGGTTYNYWTTPIYIKGAHTPFAPAVTYHPWNNGGHISNALVVAFTGNDGRIYFGKDPKSTFFDMHHLSTDANSNSGPSIISHRDHLFIAYKGSGSDTSIHIARNKLNPGRPDHWSLATVSGSTGTARTVVRPQLVNYDGSLLAIFRGHNNTHIWIYRSDDEGATWNNQGYIDGVETNHAPTAVSTNYGLLLAFKPLGSYDIDVVKMTLEADVLGDKPAHHVEHMDPV